MKTHPVSLFRPPELRTIELASILISWRMPSYRCSDLAVTLIQEPMNGPKAIVLAACKQREVAPSGIQPTGLCPQQEELISAYGFQRQATERSVEQQAQNRTRILWLRTGAGIHDAPVALNRLFRFLPIFVCLICSVRVVCGLNFFSGPALAARGTCGSCGGFVPTGTRMIQVCGSDQCSEYPSEEAKPNLRWFGSTTSCIIGFHSKLCRLDWFLLYAAYA